MVRGFASVVLLGTALVGLRPQMDGARLPSGAGSADGVDVDGYPALVTDGALLRQDGVDAMKRGLAEQRAKRPDAAEAAFRQAAELLPGFRDWALVHAAAAAGEAGRADSVEAILARVDPWLALERGWSNRVSALRRSGRTAAALPVALDAAERLGTADRRAAASFQAAQIQLTLRDTAGAAASFRRALEIAPSTTVALDAARALAALPGARPRDQLAIGRLYARHGNGTRAVTGLTTFVTSSQGTVAERGGASVELAQELFDLRRYADAERRLNAALATALPDSIAAEATLLLGRSQYRQGRTAPGRATLLSVGERYPGQRAASEAYWIVADLDHDDGRIASARENYGRSLTAKADAYHGRISAMRVGSMTLVAGDAAGAARIFEEYHRGQNEPDWRQQAAFWTGRALLDAGDSAAARPFLREATTIDPVAWYGLRAADLLGDDRLIGRLAAVPATGETGRQIADGALRRLALLRELDLEDDYTLELEHVRVLSGDAALYAIAEGLHAMNRTLDAVLLGRSIKRVEGVWNARLLRIVYPFPYRDEIMSQTTSRGLDPFLVAGLIRQESLFDARARSVAGALGLMQVLPSTGRALARKDGVSPFQTAQLYQPVTNVRLGTLYFADLLSRYDGRISYVLAAYNAGPSRVARWREMPEAGDPDLFAERIPFRETRDYVKVVQQNARIYRAVYGE